MAIWAKPPGKNMTTKMISTPVTMVIKAGFSIKNGIRLRNMDWMP